ncbi:FG-GAP-like repeat-containing protein, partial [Acidobacteriota bacterium]
MAVALCVSIPAVSIAQMPDLVVSEVDTANVTGDWQTLQVSGTVRITVFNGGNQQAAGMFTVLLFEDTNRSGDYEFPADKVLGSGTTADLDAGSQVNVTVPVNTIVEFRNNLIHAFADSDNVIAESVEDNNIWDSGLSCFILPTVGSFTPIIEWVWNSSSVEPDALNVMSTPAIIDINSDTVPDVIFGSTASTGGGRVEIGVLRALNGDDGTEIFTVDDPLYYVNTASSVAVGDIDNDGLPEILACDTSGAALLAFEHDGSYKWRSPALEAINWGAPSIADLDGDGTPEIVVGRQVLNNDGSVRWTGTAGSGSQGSGPLSFVSDIDLDGRPEIVAGNTAYGPFGAVEWQAAVPDGTTAAGNFDDDFYAEIALVSGGNVYLLEHDGSVKWGPSVIPGGGRGGPPIVADFDNDRQREIGVAAGSRYAVFET